MALDEKAAAAGFKVGDRVRTLDGTEGTIAVFSNDGVTAFVLPDGQSVSEPFLQCRLIDLVEDRGERHP